MKKITFAFLFLLSPVFVLAQDLNFGADAYASTCAHCHGGNGQGAQLGPSLLQRVAEENDADLLAFLRTGNPARGMPPVVIAEENMPDLIGYLRFLSATVADSSFSTEDTRNQYASIPRIENFTPVTEEMLLNPSENDWLWYSRTADAQRFSPLDQINKDNVGQLGLAWSKGLPDGITETIPTVYDGIMYITLPGAGVAALDATTGDTIWEYEREYGGNNLPSFEGGLNGIDGSAGRPVGLPSGGSRGGGANGRSKTLSIFADMIYFTAPDETVIALDARTGEVRWEAITEGRSHTSGSIVVEGKVISGGGCRQNSRESCYISAHDAYTGELLWKFYTTQAPDDPPGYDTWGGAPLSSRVASTWGLPGGYDEETGLIYWSVANPMPNTRADRHDGDADAISYSAPSDLYSNSTVTLDPDTGELAWYYQHLPGDDWDEDMNQERIILTTKINPDPDHVRWINPNITPGEERDVIVNIGEGGGMWVLDKHTGEFIWASPFPANVDNFILSDIDVNTGRTFINRELVLDEPGEHHIICYFNTRSFWPTSYNPEKNFLYVPYIRNCLNMTAATPATDTMPAMPESRIGIPEPGIALDELNGLAKINMETGEITHWPSGIIPNNSAILSTAGDLIFWGDINRRYQALDADTGEVLWETILGAPISVSNITYSVDGRQYIAVIAGDTMAFRGLNTGTMGPVRLDIKSSYENNSIYVFALPQNTD